MIGIAVICLLLCGGILVFALNPDMTDALAQRMYGNGNNAETATETADKIRFLRVVVDYDVDRMQV